MRKTIVLGITSGIAAFKTLELITLLRDEGIDVHVIMTEHTTKMVSLSEFETATGNPVLIELFEKDFDYKKILKTRVVDHIALADKADIMIIAPATANVIAKLAYGLADDFLTTTALAVTAPIIICPSMNVHMWHNPVVQENLAKLKNRGYQIMDPASGMLACGYEGKGRLEDVNIIKDEIMRQFSRTTSLHGKKVLVTAGGTIEKIDDVRSITNRSSGKMGIAIAEECYLRGADVTLLHAKNAVEPRYQMHEETFTTADELENLINKYGKEAGIIFHVAAVSDFTVEKKDGKITSDEEQNIALKPRTKILHQIKKINPKIFLVAFKAEYNLSENELIEKAKKTLEENNADVIIANDISSDKQGFEADVNEVIMVKKNGINEKLQLADKRIIAMEIFDYLSENLK